MIQLFCCCLLLISPFTYAAGVANAQQPDSIAVKTAGMEKQSGQLSAHEVGHTLGPAHNFAASTAGQASVMDYPHPLVTIRDDGTLDLSRAYEVGIGE